MTKNFVLKSRCRSMYGRPLPQLRLWASSCQALFGHGEALYWNYYMTVKCHLSIYLRLELLNLYWKAKNILFSVVCTTKMALACFQ